MGTEKTPQGRDRSIRAHNETIIAAAFFNEYAPECYDIFPNGHPESQEAILVASVDGH